MMENDEDIADEDSYKTMMKEIMGDMLKKTVSDVLKTLTSKEEKIVRLRFGIDNETEKTLEEVGKVFDVTRERVRQIEKKALKKLRHPSRSKKLKGWHNEYVKIREIKGGEEQKKKKRNICIQEKRESEETDE